jgi:hypothetical protein
MPEAGWGLFFTVFVGFPFLLVALSPRRGRTAVVQLTASVVAMAMAAVASLEWRAQWLGAGIAVATAIVGLLLGPIAAMTPRQNHFLMPSAPILAMVIASGLPWLAYAWRMAALNRGNRPGADITVGIDHYAVQAATALGIVLLALLAAAWVPGRRLLAGSAGLVGLYLGMLALAWPGAEAGIGRGWAVAATAWGAALIALAWSPVATAQPA